MTSGSPRTFCQKPSKVCTAKPDSNIIKITMISRCLRLTKVPDMINIVTGTVINIYKNFRNHSSGRAQRHSEGPKKSAGTVDGRINKQRKDTKRSIRAGWSDNICAESTLPGCRKQITFMSKLLLHSLITSEKF